MAQQQQTRASPTLSGVSIAHRVLEDAANAHLATGNAAEARAEVKELAGRLWFYEDIAEACNDVLMMIRKVELAEQRDAEERQQQQQRELVMAVMGTLQTTYGKPPEGKRAKVDADSEDLPPKLCTEKAMRMWQKLQTAGYIDEDFQPKNLSRTESALLADTMATELGIWDKWKTFETLWRKNNMRSDYNDALDQRKSLAFRDKLKALFTE